MSGGETAVIGATISIITVVNNAVFPVDYRMLKRTATQTDNLVLDIRRAIVDFDPAQSTENKKAWRNEILEKIKQINNLEEKMLAGFTVDFGSTAYAQAQLPPWVSQLPADKTGFYFVGSADDASLAQAKEGSFNNAVEQAAELLAKQVSPHLIRSGEIRIDALPKYIKKVAKIADTTFSYDRKTQVYRYFTLLKLSREFANPNYILKFQ